MSDCGAVQSITGELAPIRPLKALPHSGWWQQKFTGEAACRSCHVCTLTKTVRWVGVPAFGCLPADHHEWTPTQAEGAAAALKAGTDLACEDYTHLK